MPLLSLCSFFFFNDTATTEIYTLSLHDALPIFPVDQFHRLIERVQPSDDGVSEFKRAERCVMRSEEHTSELQSPCNLVCRLLLEKKDNFSTVASFGARFNSSSYL